jgi:hypothetical protein
LVETWFIRLLILSTAKKGCPLADNQHLVVVPQGGLQVRAALRVSKDVRIGAIHIREKRRKFPPLKSEVDGRRCCFLRWSAFGVLRPTVTIIVQMVAEQVDWETGNCHGPTSTYYGMP